MEKQKIREKFDQAYRNLYTRIYPEVEVECINLKVKGTVAETHFEIPPVKAENKHIKNAIKGYRKIFLPESGLRTVPFMIDPPFSGSEIQRTCYH
jgi:hypothetical protein